MKFVRAEHNGAISYEAESETHFVRILKVDGGWKPMILRKGCGSSYRVLPVVATLAFAKQDAAERLDI